MRLQVKRGERRKGLVFKSTIYFVEVFLEASDDEKKQIKEQGLLREIVGSVALDFPESSVVHLVRDLLRGARAEFLKVKSLALFEANLRAHYADLRYQLGLEVAPHDEDVIEFIGEVRGLPRLEPSRRRRGHWVKPLTYDANGKPSHQTHDNDGNPLFPRTNSHGNPLFPYADEEGRLIDCATDANGSPRHRTHDSHGNPTGWIWEDQ